jgi:hypothetical protein
MKVTYAMSLLMEPMIPSLPFSQSLSWVTFPLSPRNGCQSSHTILRIVRVLAIPSPQLSAVVIVSTHFLESHTEHILALPHEHVPFPSSPVSIVSAMSFRDMSGDCGPHSRGDCNYQ